MSRYNLGAGTNILPGWVNCDLIPAPGIDMVFNLDVSLGGHRIPLDSNSADEFLLSHVLEHLQTPLGLMQELWRIGKPDCKLTARVPYGSSDDAWEDQTHVRAYFLQSWGYFSQPYHWRSLGYGYTADWQPEKVTLLMEDKWARRPLAELNQLVRHQRNIVREMVCVFRKVSPPRLAQRDLQVLPKIDIEVCR